GRAVVGDELDDRAAEIEIREVDRYAEPGLLDPVAHLDGESEDSRIELDRAIRFRGDDFHMVDPFEHHGLLRGTSGAPKWPPTPPTLGSAPAEPDALLDDGFSNTLLTARHSRSRPSGIAVIDTPGSRSASATAFAIAAGAGSAPPSPAPLTPSGFSGDGVTTCPTSSEGTSSARGSAYSISVPVVS